MADYLEQLIKQKAKQVQQKKQLLKPPNANSSSTSSLFATNSTSTLSQRDQQLKNLKATLSGKKSEHNSAIRQAIPQSRPSQNVNPHIAQQQKAQAKVEPPPKREQTDREKAEMLKMIEMNMNIGIIMAGQQQSHPTPPKKAEKPKLPQDYDPLDVDFGRKQAINEVITPNSKTTSKSDKDTSAASTQDSKNINQILNQNLRKSMGVSASFEEIKKRVEEEQLEQREKIRREQKMAEKRKRELKEARNKERVYVDQAKDAKEAEIKKLQMKLKESKSKKHSHNSGKSQKKQGEPPVEDKVFCSQCQIRHSVNYHRERGHFNNIKVSVDTEARELKPSVNVIDSKRSVKTTTTVMKTYHQQQPKTPSITLQKQLAYPERFLQQKNQQSNSSKPLLGKRSHQERQSQDYDYSSDDLDDEDEYDQSFIASDDEHQNEVVKKELQKVVKNLGAKQQYSDDENTDNMEADYETIEREERRAQQIAKREDYEEQLKIEAEEREERRQKRLKKMEKKKEKMSGNQSEKKRQKTEQLEIY